MHCINHLILYSIVFSCMNNSCVRLDTASLMLMSLLHPLLHVTQWYYGSVCHDGWLFLLLFSGYRGGQPIAFDLFNFSSSLQGLGRGEGTEDAAVKCHQSTPCITVDQLLLYVWNLNNSLTPNPSGDILLNWIMKIDRSYSFLEIVYAWLYFNIYK